VGVRSRQWLKSNAFRGSIRVGRYLQHSPNVCAGHSRQRLFVYLVVPALTSCSDAVVDLFFRKVELVEVAALRETLTVVEESRDCVLPYHKLYPIWAVTVN
jgi:hypothetical protein